jgi:hypothetical protein
LVLAVALLLVCALSAVSLSAIDLDDADPSVGYLGVVDWGVGQLRDGMCGVGAFGGGGPAACDGIKSEQLQSHQPRLESLEHRPEGL